MGYAGVIAFNLLALTTLPVWLIYTLAIITPLLLLCFPKRYVQACAALFFFYNFLIAGVTIGPAILAAITLAFLVNAVLYQIPLLYSSLDIEELEYLSENMEAANQIKYMTAEIVAIAAMVCMFKFASAIIIAAAAPHAVAILGAIGAALAVASFAGNKGKEHTLYKYILVFSHSPTNDEEDNTAETNIALTFVIAAFAAGATFMALSSFPITITAAPIVIAALIAFNTGIIARQAVIQLANMAIKAANIYTELKYEIKRDEQELELRKILKANEINPNARFGDTLMQLRNNIIKSAMTDLPPQQYYK